MNFSLAFRKRNYKYLRSISQDHNSYDIYSLTSESKLTKTIYIFIFSIYNVITFTKRKKTKPYNRFTVSNHLVKPFTLHRNSHGIPTA